MTFFVDMLLEGRKEYLSKYASQPDIEDVLGKFWALRHRVSAPKNDIDWWIKRPYEDLKQFVNDFDVRSRSVRRSDAHARAAEKYGAKMLGMAGQYEVWYIPSHEAAQEIGRMYKGVSAKWCISTENPEYFYQSYNEYEFVFLVLAEGEAEEDGFEKLALQLKPNYGGKCDLHCIWDANDNSVQDTDEFQKTATSDAIDAAMEMFDKSGLSRKKYQDENAEKFVNDPEWVKNTLFKGHPELSVSGDGSCVAEYELDWLDDIIDDSRYEDVGAETARKILQYEYFDVFDSPNEPSFEYVGKAEKIFNKALKPYGIKWDMLEKVYKGDVPDDMDDEVYEWLFEKLDGDFYEGNGYYAVWCDSYINGTGNEAREDILGQLRYKAGIASCEYSNDAGDLMMKRVFSKNDVLNAAKRRLEGLPDDPLVLMIEDEVSLNSPPYGWSGFDEDMMAEAVAEFAKRLIGFITMQKDRPGQMHFDFDDDYIDNPENLPRS